MRTVQSDSMPTAALRAPRRKSKAKPSSRVGITIFTIGYQERSTSEFVTLLREHGVKTIVDIRAVPLSRRPDFRKNALAAVLEAAGIRYVGLAGLGTPKEIRERLKAEKNYPAFFSSFRRYMMTRRSDLKTLVDIAQSEAVGLLCFERIAAQCHRSVVAAYVSNKLGCNTVDI